MSRLSSEIWEAVKFYTETLGFKISSNYKTDGSRGITEIAFLSLGTTSLEQLEFPKAASISQQPHIDYMIAITVDDLDAAIKYLKENVVNIT